ncbi:MAG: PAS domain-containing protein [Spirochaetales bacterium]|nr:PAS domain-containing protein [Spirochaetales bacterium]
MRKEEKGKQGPPEKIRKNTGIKELSAGNQFAYLILHQMPYPVAVYTSDGTICMVNQAFLDMAGIASAGLIAGKYNIFTDSSIVEITGLKEQIKQACAGNTVFVPEIITPLQSIDKESGITEQRVVIHEATVFPVYDTGGKVCRVVMILKDITGQKQAEKAMEKDKKELIATLKSIGDAVISTNSEGKIIVMNRIAENLTGYREEEASGKPVEKIFRIVNEEKHESILNPVKEVIEQGKITSLKNDTILVSRDGTHYSIMGSSAPICIKDGIISGVVLVFRNVTERRLIRQEMEKENKLESLGLLAEGIAHDFNNILTAILTNIGAALYEIPESSNAYIFLSRTEEASRQARKLTQQLLAFAKGGKPVKKIMPVTDFLKETIEFVLSGSNIISRFDIQDDLWPVNIDEGQITQVFHNLIINAEQAMPEGGIITVKARNEQVTSSGIIPLHPGKYILITIADIGKGIPEKYLKKIFDPYFSTKQRGRGLGLTITFSIIKQHGGYLSINSKPGEGTTATIYLPASLQSPGEREMIKENAKLKKGKILFMDDNPHIRDIMSKILEKLGHHVIFAWEGDSAIEQYKAAKEKGEPFDLCIIDLTIHGGRGGKSTMEELVKIDPGVKAIVSSGYSGDPLIAEYEKYGFIDYLVKPYKIEELIARVEEHL